MVRQMHGLIQTGKVRYWGVMNWPVEEISKAWETAVSEKLTPPCAAQLPYSLLRPDWVEAPEARDLLYNDRVASLLFGATKISHIDENLHTLAILPYLNVTVITKLRHLE